MSVTFYRAVSFAELADVRRVGRLRSSANSCEGKHLARSAEDARRWGETLHGASTFGVVRVTVSDATAAEFFRWDNLDGIGPACFATIEQLDGAEIAEVTE